MSSGLDNRTVTDLLAAAASGDRSVMEALFERVYPELKRLAHTVRGGRGGDTLSTTALAHEAYLRLAAGSSVSWEGRAHFMAVAGRAMRHILVDAARAQLAKKRGAGEELLSFDEAAVAGPVRPDMVTALDEALARLAAVHPRRAAVVEQRFFVGLTAAETAFVLGVSTATVERDWRVARAWLATELEADERA